MRRTCRNRHRRSRPRRRRSTPESGLHAAGLARRHARDGSGTELLVPRRDPATRKHAQLAAWRTDPAQPRPVGEPRQQLGQGNPPQPESHDVRASHRQIRRSHGIREPEPPDARRQGPDHRKVRELLRTDPGRRDDLDAPSALFGVPLQHRTGRSRHASERPVPVGRNQPLADRKRRMQTDRPR